MARKDVVVENLDVDRYDVSASRFAPVAAGGNNKSNAIPIEQSAEDRDLYEAIVASFLETKSQRLDEDDNGDEMRVVNPFPTGARSSSSRKRKKRPYGGSSVAETGRPSNSNSDPSFTCEICPVPRTDKDTFPITGCSHAFCKDCVTKYVASKLHDNVTHMGCPVSGCGGVLELGYCSSILPPEVVDRWGKSLCEALILEAERFYCPFRDCSALLIDDGGEVIRESECPNCLRLFCAQCRVPWHAGLECREFQGLDEGEKGSEHIMIEQASSPSSRKPKRKKKSCGGSLVIETDKKLNANPDPSFVCEICIEPRTNSDLFCIKGCSHAYCNDCVTRYLTSKLNDNVTHINCPVSGCGGILEPEYCRLILPPEVFDRWGNALCEALILEADRFYCPFKDCSALLINDEGTVLRESECPHCWRLFCAQCRVPWHAGVECQEFQGLNEGERGREDIMLMELAEKKHWKRCPKCRFFVQKKSGCPFVKCRCGVEFCYRCGAEAEVSHYCSKCQC